MNEQLRDRAVRLRALDRMAREAEKRGNIQLHMRILEQAAKEVGDMFVNTQQAAATSGLGNLESVEFCIDTRERSANERTVGHYSANLGNER